MSFWSYKIPQGGFLRKDRSGFLKRNPGLIIFICFLIYLPTSHHCLIGNTKFGGVLFRHNKLIEEKIKELEVDKENTQKSKEAISIVKEIDSSVGNVYTEYYILSGKIYWAKTAVSIFFFIILILCSYHRTKKSQPMWKNPDPRTFMYKCIYFIIGCGISYKIIGSLEAEHSGYYFIGMCLMCAVCVKDMEVPEEVKIYDNYSTREMNIADYDGIYEMWKSCTGMGMDAVSDSREGMQRYLTRNPALSFIAIADEKIIGTILCGHDGRNGYIYHLAVANDFRKQGIAKALVEQSLKGLRAQNISNCNIGVFADNETGRKFWNNTEWNEIKNLVIMNKEV